jgi:hypothetical protein
MFAPQPKSLVLFVQGEKEVVKLGQIHDSEM